MLTCKNYKGLRIAVPTDTNIRFLDQGDLKKTFSILFEEMGFELTDRSRAKDVSIYQHKEDNLLYIQWSVGYQVLYIEYNDKADFLYEFDFNQNKTDIIDGILQAIRSKYVKYSTK